MLQRTPTLSRADALRERDWRHLEFDEAVIVAADATSLALLTPRQQAVLNRFIRIGETAMGRGRCTPTNGPEPFDHVADRDMDDDGPEFENDPEDFE